MNQQTAISFFAALLAHVAMLFGVSLPEQPLPEPPEEYLEVELYQPPPAAEPEPEQIAPPPVPEPPPPTPEPPPLQETPPPPPEPPPEVMEPPLGEPPPTIAKAEIPQPEPKPIPPPPPAPAKKAPAPPRKTESRPAAPRASSSAEANSNTYHSVGTVSYVRRGRAIYPSESLRLNQEGTVTLMLYINEFGGVDKVEVVQSSGYAALDAAAITAEKKSRFRPAVSSGRPVKSKARVPYVFTIE